MSKLRKMEGYNALFLSSQLQLCIFLGWNMLLKQNGIHLEQMEFFHCRCTGGFPPAPHLTLQLFNPQTDPCGQWPSAVSSSHPDM